VIQGHNVPARAGASHTDDCPRRTRVCTVSVHTKQTPMFPYVGGELFEQKIELDDGGLGLPNAIDPIAWSLGEPESYAHHHRHKVKYRHAVSDHGGRTNSSKDLVSEYDIANPDQPPDGGMRSFSSSLVNAIRESSGGHRMKQEAAEATPLITAGAAEGGLFTGLGSYGGQGPSGLSGLAAPGLQHAELHIQPTITGQPGAQTEGLDMHQRLNSIVYLNNASIECVNRGGEALPLALQYLEKALILQVGAADRQHSSILYGNVANVLFKLQRPYESLEYYMRALQAEMELGVDDETAAATISNVGYVYASMGRVEEAILHYRRAVDLRGRVACDHPETVANLADIANCIRRSKVCHRRRRHTARVPPAPAKFPGISTQID